MKKLFTIYHLLLTKISANVKIKLNPYCLIFISVFLLFRGFFLFAQSDFVERVEIEGNISVKTKKILSKIATNAGGIYSEKILLEDVRRIYELGKFEDVQVSVSTTTKGVVVKFILKEKPRVKKIEFVGNKNISKTKLKEKLTISKGDYFTETQLNEQVKSLLQLYGEEGYSQAKINYYIGKEDEKGRSPITFYIEEGEKIVIKKVSIFGTRVFPEKKIKNLMETREKKVYSPEKLKDDVDKMEKFYKDRGFARFSISKPYVIYDDKNKNITILIFIYEGNKYKLGSITFSGNVLKKTKDLQKILKQNKFIKGEMYSKKKEDAVLEAIQQFYADDGYLKVLAYPEYTYEGDKVNIEFKISEGPQIFIRKIFIEGNRRTKDFVIRREITVKEGDPFKLTNVRESQRKIFNLGFFSDVQIIPTDTHIPDKMDLTFEVTEQQTGMLSLGAGYSSQDRFVGTLQVSETNFRGMGQRLSALVEYGERRKNYNISFTEPYLFGKNLSLTASIYDITRTKEYSDAILGRDVYDEHKRGGRLGFGKKILKIYRINFSYSYEDVNLLNIEDWDTYMLDQKDYAEKRGRISKFGFGTKRDTRDFFWDPEKGSIQEISFDIATGLFGGQNFFHRQTLQTSHFLRIVWHLVFVFNFRAGAVYGYGSTKDVPVYERFYVGGGESVRGYDYKGDIGPSEGGRFMNVTNFELKFPLVREKKQTVLQWAFFFDFGGCWNDIKDLKWSFGQTEDNFKRGWGMGIRFKIPAFPVRLDWARGLDHRPGEEETQWYFTIGDIFW